MTRAESAHCRLAAALLLGATACVPIPHKHAEEPSAEFLVTDQQRRPLAGARITIYRGSGIGHDSMKPQLTLTTDTAGTVRVRGRERWHFVFVAIPDAEAGHRWAWCVEASGFSAAHASARGRRSHLRSVGVGDDGRTLPILASLA